MSIVVINPENYETNYLNYLNTCFPNWGNKTTFDWIFNRKCGLKKADFLILKDDNDQVIAGSAVTYRKLKLADKSIVDIGIMTGSWTLPEARGKGCFSQIIEESKIICSKNKVSYLTAFVTDINASYRRLKEADFFEKTAINFFSNDTLFSISNSNKEFKFKNNDDLSIDFWFDNYLKSNENKSSFVYNKTAFETQYLNRINQAQSVSINQSFFLFEDTQTIIKLLFITDFDIENLQFFCNWIRETKNKKVMFFTSNAIEIEQLKNNNFTFVNGYLMIQNTTQNSDIFNKLNINLGDKM